MAKKKLWIIMATGHPSDEANTTATAAIIGAKLRKIASMLQSTGQIEIVEKEFFERESDSNAVFFAHMGGNGTQFTFAVVLDHLATGDDFGGDE